MGRGDGRYVGHQPRRHRGTRSPSFVLCTAAGAVLEFHLYHWEQGATADDKVWEVVRPAVCRVLPEICSPDFRLLGGYVQTKQVHGSSRTVLVFAWQREGCD